jgi:hypothetical protein
MNQLPFGQSVGIVVSEDRGEQTEQDIVTQRSYEAPRIIAGPDNGVNQVETETVIGVISDAGGVSIEANNDTTNETAAEIDEVSQAGEVSDEIPVIDFDNTTTNGTAAETNPILQPEELLNEILIVDSYNETPNETTTEDSFQDEKLVLEVTMVFDTDNDTMNQIDNYNIAYRMCLIPRPRITKCKDYPHVYQEAKDETAESDDIAAIGSVEEDIYTSSESSDEKYWEEKVNELEERLTVVSGYEDRWHGL